MHPLFGAAYYFMTNGREFRNRILKTPNRWAQRYGASSVAQIQLCQIIAMPIPMQGLRNVPFVIQACLSTYVIGMPGHD
jgi:hypothetical protein